MTATAPDIAAAFAAFPDPVRQQLWEVRRQIFKLAEEHGVGPLTESLKWGQPAYHTPRKAGSPVRLGTSKALPEVGQVFFICTTSLVSEFRTLFPDADCFIDNRAIRLDRLPADNEGMMALCLSRALTYHKRASARG